MFTVLEVCFMLTTNLLPPILDVGIQIWNGVTINQLEFKKNKEWSATDNITNPDNRTRGAFDHITIIKPEKVNATDSISFPDDIYDSISIPNNTNNFINFPNNTNDFIKFPSDKKDFINFPNNTNDYINFANGTHDSDNNLNVTEIVRRRRSSEILKDSTLESQGTGNTNFKKKDTQNSVKHVAFHVNISKEIKFVITYEALISITLLQLPALCLGILGMIRAFQNHGMTFPALKAVLSASLIIFTPFFFVQVFSVFELQFTGVVKFIKSTLQLLVGLVCGKCNQTWFDKLDLLHFLPKGKEKLLYVEVTKIFFGSCIQLCFQATLLFGYSEPEDVTLSQIISIVASTLVISKTGIDAVLFERENESENEDGVLNFAFLYQKLKLLKTILCHVPLVLSSAVFHMGTLVMIVLVWEFYSIIYIVFVFCISLASFSFLPTSSIQQAEKNLHLTRRSICKEHSNKSQFLTNFYLSWANLFILTRPIQQLTISMHSAMSVLSLLHFITNLITLLTLLTYVEIAYMMQTQFY